MSRADGSGRGLRRSPISRALPPRTHRAAEEGGGLRGDAAEPCGGSGSRAGWTLGRLLHLFGPQCPHLARAPLAWAVSSDPPALAFQASVRVFPSAASLGRTPAAGPNLHLSIKFKNSGVLPLPAELEILLLTGRLTWGKFLNVLLTGEIGE